MKRVFLAWIGLWLGFLGQAASSLSVAPPPNAYGWNNTPVTVTLTGQQRIYWQVNGGPINSDAPPVVLPFTDEGVYAVRYRDETETNFKTAAIRLDFTPPRIAIRIPESGGTYILNQPVSVDWSAWDALSGLAEVQATAMPGGALDTRSPGQQKFRVWAKDRAGNEAEEIAVYFVRGVLQAVLPSGFYLDRLLPPEQRAKVGRYTLMARYTAGEEVTFAFLMKDYFGRPYARAWPEITVVGVRFVEEKEEYPLRAWFRVPFDQEKGFYVLVIPTKDYAPGYYDLWVLFGDGQFERIRFEVLPKP